MGFSEDEITKFLIQQATTNEQLSNAIGSMSKDMHTMSKSMQKIEVLLTKIDSLEKEATERNSRLHHRLDEANNEFRAIQDMHGSTGCSSLQKTVQMLESLEERLLDPENGIIPGIKENAKEEKRNRVWLWRTLFTVIFTALVGLLFNMFKTG